MTSCTWKETAHVHPELFVTSSIGVVQELGGGGACDTCCNRTVAGQDWTNEHVHSLKKLKLKYWTLPCQERFKFGAGDPVQDGLLDFCFCTRGLRDHASFRGAKKINAADRQRHIESVGSTI